MVLLSGVVVRQDYSSWSYSKSSVIYEKQRSGTTWISTEHTQNQRQRISSLAAKKKMNSIQMGVSSNKRDKEKRCKHTDWQAAKQNNNKKKDRFPFLYTNACLQDPEERTTKEKEQSINNASCRDTLPNKGKTKKTSYNMCGSVLFHISPLCLSLLWHFWARVVELLSFCFFRVFLFGRSDAPTNFFPVWFYVSSCNKDGAVPFWNSSFLDGQVYRKQ